jgi:hypothetical protein
LGQRLYWSCLVWQQAPQGSGRRPSSALGPVWWVMAQGWAALPQLRWRGVPFLAVLGVRALVTSRGCAAIGGLPAHSGAFFPIRLLPVRVAGVW